MSHMIDNGGTSRRRFLGSLAAGAGAIGVATTLPFGLPHAALAETPTLAPNDPDSLFTGIKGKHRAVFDIFEGHGIFPFIGPRAFILTNAATGTPPSDLSVVVVLRHEAVPFALGSNLWAKYHFGEALKFDDPDTKAPAVRNIFWQPGPNDFMMPGFGRMALGINELQADGVMFVVCDAALTGMSADIAQHTNQDPKAVKQEFLASLLPNVHDVPSGVWALGRAQEHGCAYCFGY